jgi:hypothetical protein
VFSNHSSPDFLRAQRSFNTAAADSGSAINTSSSARINSSNSNDTAYVAGRSTAQQQPIHASFFAAPSPRSAQYSNSSNNNNMQYTSYSYDNGNSYGNGYGNSYGSNGYGNGYGSNGYSSNNNMHSSHNGQQFGNANAK